MSSTITIDETVGERIWATFHTGQHKPFTVYWKVSGNGVEYICTHFYRNFRAALKIGKQRGIHISTIWAEPLEETRIKKSDDADQLEMLIAPTHMLGIVADWMIYHPKATDVQLNRFIDLAFSGGSFAEDSMRAAFGAVHNISDEGEYECFRSFEIKHNLNDVIRFRNDLAQ